MSRHIIKQNNPSKRIKHISVILLSAGIEDRAKGQGTPCLFDIGSMSMLDYQIDTVNKIFDTCEIIPVVGFQSTKIMNRVHNKVGFIENQLYEDTNCVESLRLALNSTINTNVLIIHGNTLFNQSTLLDHTFNKSFVLYDKKGKEGGVGLISNSGILSNMYYGLPKKWCNILYVTGKTTGHLRTLVNKNKHSKKVMYEIINEMIPMSRIHAVECPESSVLEINNFRAQRYEINNIIKNG